MEQPGRKSARIGRRLRVAAGLGLAFALLASTSARAEETVQIAEAAFSPDALGAPTNAFGKAVIGSTDGPVPSPITHVDVYGPAGLTLNLEGSTTCVRERLEREGPKACSANSRAGTGGGEGAYELSHEIVKEPYTLEFFLTDNRPGHVAMVILLRGSSPVSIEIYLTALVFQARAPYGLGFSVEVPLIKVLPEASDASATSSFIDLGAHGASYRRRLHGREQTVPVKGIVLPRRCPRGGWPVASRFSFQDGETVMATRTIRCPT